MKTFTLQSALLLLLGYSAQIASSFVLRTTVPPCTSTASTSLRRNPRLQTASPCALTVNSRIRQASKSRLASSSSESTPDSPAPDYSQEDTLLKVHFVIQPGVQPEEAASALSKFSQSFPFAAVLPVQPMQYLPAEDGGVEIKFLRKKTDIKSGIDGGIRFFLEQSQSSSSAEDEDHEDDDAPYELELTAKRNSVGQSISKIMSEKLIVTSYVAALTTAIDKPSPIHEKLSMTSMFHKWM